jgi:hypothetical protein
MADQFDVEIDEGEFIPLPAPLGYMVVRDEKGDTFADWDGKIHSEREDGELEILTAKRREPLYEWYLAEVRRAETGGE